VGSLKLVGIGAVLFLVVAPGYAADLTPSSPARVLAASALGTDAAPSTTWTLFQGSIFNPVQIYSETVSVRGLRINLFYGKNANVRGLDIGIVNQADDLASGFQAAGIANAARELDGVQIAFGFNDARGRASGFQGAGFVNLAGKLKGAQIGFMYNEVEERAAGFQATSVANFASTLEGVQLALLHNRSASVVGAQISLLVNQTDDLAGVQIGLLNFNEGGLLPFFPLLNFGFGR
jgi:hypothetical protein